MEETWITILSSAITAFATAFTTWFFTKRKYNAEVDNNVITNMQESLEFYKTLADDNKARLENVLKENADNRKENAEIRQENIELRKEVADLRGQVERLTNLLAEYGLQKLIEEK